MLILASQSPRRAELLRQVGIDFRIEPAAIDEHQQPGESAEDYVHRMACAKAAAVHNRYADSPVLGADTAVVLGDRILGKPRDRNDAVAMLLALSGNTHRVLTGVALVTHATDYRLSTSRVRFRAIEPAEATAYWETGEPVDKAGGYAIQGIAAAFIEHIEGSYSGIMGLPLFETLQMLQVIGVRGHV